MADTIQVIKTSEGDEARTSKNKILEYGIQYLVIGAESKSAALDAVYSECPKIYNGMFLNSVRFSSFNGDAGGIEITAQYAEVDATLDSDDTEDTFTFDTSGGTTKIIQGIGLVAKTPGDAPDPGAFIGWNGKTGEEADFAGVEKVTPALKLSFAKKIKYSAFTNKYMRTLAELTGTVNASAFKGWEAGEVLFTGVQASGVVKSGAEVSLTFSFMVSPNVTNQQFGGHTVRKKGWIYLWSIPTNKQKNGKIYVEQLGIYLTKIYTETDFKLLKI